MTTGEKGRVSQFIMGGQTDWLKRFKQSLLYPQGAAHFCAQLFLWHHFFLLYRPESTKRWSRKRRKIMNDRLIFQTLHVSVWTGGKVTDNWRPIYNCMETYHHSYNLAFPCLHMIVFWKKLNFYRRLKQAREIANLYWHDRWSAQMMSLYCFFTKKIDCKVWLIQGVPWKGC